MINVVLHGSFRRHLPLIQEAAEKLTDAGATVLAPTFSSVIDDGSNDGFVRFEGEAHQPASTIELVYLNNLRKLGSRGFSYFICPEGLLGTSSSYELGISSAIGVRCIFSNSLQDHPAFVSDCDVIDIDSLARCIKTYGMLPPAFMNVQDQYAADLMDRLLPAVPVVAVGGIIEYRSKILLVRTHKWGNRWSVIGGKWLRGETLVNCFGREAHEETGLDIHVDSHLLTFEQKTGSGYWNATRHLFIDYVARAQSRKVTLNHEAQEACWADAGHALDYLDLEPNAREIVELYARKAA